MKMFKKALGGFGLLAGISYPFRTLALLQRYPRLLPYLLIPVGINILLGLGLYIGLIFLGWQTVENFTLTLSNQLDLLLVNLPTWLSFLQILDLVILWILRGILILGVLLGIGFFLVEFGSLLGAPWYGKLSEELEKLQTGTLQIVEVGLAKDLGRAILFEIKKLILAGGIGLLLLLLNAIIPLFSILLAPIGGICIPALLICLDFFDSTLERRRLPFRKKVKIVFQSLPASASFSLVCLGLVSIPFLNLLTVPICIASGTIFCCDRVLPKLSSG